MAEATNDLIYEVLKAMQERTARMDSKLDEVKGELQAIRQHQFAAFQEVANIYLTLSRHDDQLERIERRLGLIEPAH